MSISELVNAISDHYICGFRDAIYKQKEKFQLATEVLLKFNNDSEELYSLNRVDMLIKNEEKYNIAIFENNTYIQFEPIKFQSKTVNFILNPCYWNFVEFKITGNFEHILPEFINWSNKWLDPTDATLNKQKEFTNLIHRIERPKYNDSFWYFAIDFGTSNYDAFSELLDILSSDKIKSVDIGSFSKI